MALQNLGHVNLAERQVGGIGDGRLFDILGMVPHIQELLGRAAQSARQGEA